MKEQIIKKSKFLSQSYPVNSLDEVKNILEKLKVEHKKASHICYAYYFGQEGVLYEKADDGGEPNGTAGNPILSVVKKSKCADTLVVVIRYFGGIKLGAGGLVRAYIKSASLALKEKQG